LSLILIIILSLQTQIEKERKNLRAIRMEIKKNRERLARLKREERSILEMIDVYDRDRQLTEEYIRRLEIQNRNLIIEIDSISSRIKDLEEKISQNKEEVKRELLRLYIWRRFYKLDLILSAKSIPEVYQTAWNLRLISRLGRKKIDRYQALIREHETAREEKKDLLFELAETKRDKEAELANLKRMIEDKKELLASIRSEKRKGIQLERELKDAQARLERLIEDLIAKSRVAKIGPMAKNLTWPCKGKVISRFGRVRHPKYNTTTRNNGIDIRAEKGTPVYAITSGTVSYSGRFLGYGNIILIEHDNGFYSLYGHLDRIMVRLGDRVERGQQIGTVGETGSLSGPMLHFELRKGGKPVDPLVWLK